MSIIEGLRQTEEYKEAYAKLLIKHLQEKFGNRQIGEVLGDQGAFTKLVEKYPDAFYRLTPIIPENEESPKKSLMLNLFVPNVKEKRFQYVEGLDIVEKGSEEEVGLCTVEKNNFELLLAIATNHAENLPSNWDDLTWDINTQLKDSI